MRAGDDDYDGVPYDELDFEAIDWRECGDHDPARRSIRKGRSEQDVLTGWADEAARDERRLAGSAKSRSGMTVKVTGYSPSAGFLITVVVAAKDSPPTWRWWGATAWKANQTDQRKYEDEGR